MNSETRNCQNCKQDFTIDSEDFNFYEKIKVPPPTFCSLCRLERRAVYRNERKLFKVKDFLTGKDIFSLYPAEGGKKSVTQEEWFSDALDNIEYGRHYDFSKSFSEQLFELDKEVPIFPLRVEFMVNSPYCANATALKNCYLCFNSNNAENCMYGNATDFSKDCIDNSHINHCERCYECFWMENCYQCYFIIMSADSHNLWFCRDCMGCNDCFGCVNLRKSSYCIFNKQYTKNEYFKIVERIKLYMDEMPFVDKKENILLPILCHDCRFERRIKDRLKMQLYERTCMCAGKMDKTGIYKNTIKHFHGDELCGEKFKIGYNPDSKEIVYCEKCYQQEVY